jgi:hypothetical protein
MRLRKLAIRGLIVSVLVLGFGLTMLSGSYATPVKKYYGNKRPPSTEQVAFAKRTYDLMFATVFAGLSQEFAETTKDNVKEGSQSISLIFNDANRDMRLIGNVDRLRATDKPSDDFEVKANAEALTTAKGIESVEKIDGKWYYRKSTPLNNGISPACVLCHVTYKPDQKVGALVLRVPIGAY